MITFTLFCISDDVEKEIASEPEEDSDEEIDDLADEPAAPSKQLTGQETIVILQRRAANRSYKDIGNELHRSHTTIARFCRLYDTQQTLDRKKGSGRKRKTSAREDRAIMIYVKRNRFLTAEDITRELALPNICNSLYARG